MSLCLDPFVKGFMFGPLCLGRNVCGSSGWGFFDFLFRVLRLGLCVWGILFGAFRLDYCVCGFVFGVFLCIPCL